MKKAERVPLLTANQTGIQEGDPDGTESIVAPQPSRWGKMYNLYTSTFGRKGWLSGAPMPAPNIPDTQEWVGDTSQWAYFGGRDALEKTLTFFSSQSVCAAGASIWVTTLPGQEFDIRKTLMVQANENFNVFFQLKQFTTTGFQSSIFWLVALPTIGRLVMGFAYYCMQPQTKEATADAYLQFNSWRSCFALYGMQALEVLLANVIINAAQVMLGTSKEALFDNPVLINGLKVAIALGLDVLRNSIGKGISHVQEKGLPCKPAGYAQLSA